MSVADAARMYEILDVDLIIQCFDEFVVKFRGVGYGQFCLFFVRKPFGVHGVRLLGGVQSNLRGEQLQI